MTGGSTRREGGIWGGDHALSGFDLGAGIWGCSSVVIHQLTSQIFGTDFDFFKIVH